MGNTRWTDEKIETVRKLAAEGKDCLDVSFLMGTTQSAIYETAKKYGIKIRMGKYSSKPQSDNPSDKPRNCMTCGQLFRSAGNQNRMCEPCRKL